MSAQPLTKLDCHSEVRFLKGVGARRAEFFAQLGVHTVGDLLEHYPRDHQFVPPLSLIAELNVDHTVTVAGVIRQLRYHNRSRPPRFELTLEDSSGTCRLLWFHGHYLRDKFLPGDFIAAWGKVSRHKECLQIINPRWLKLDNIEQLTERENTGRGVYPANADLSSNNISKIINLALPDLLNTVEERYDEKFHTQRQLPTRRDALAWIHQPTTPEHVARARRRLAYDELFLMELGIALRREQIRQTQPAYPLAINDRIDQRIRRLFPFALTDDQSKVIAEICDDMAHAKPMNRLLQGDVGAGKTVVALYAALLAISHRHQVAMMAPTEILAEQHFASLEHYLKNSRVKRVLLTGGITGAKRAELMAQINTGQIDIVVGTQALLQTDVTFSKLALVVVDEQHKFGVRQRRTMRGKDLAPHYLVMTATPIPRTLAMTVFGDLDVSVIKQLPPGRRNIITRCYEPAKLPQAYQFIRQQLQKGRQAYFVYPRVEDSADPAPTDSSGTNLANNNLNASGLTTEPLKAAVAEQKYLQQQIFPEFNVALLHGQMDRQTKQQTMDDFRSGRIDVLVATIVIEVGVDVPNATIMVVEHTEQFGLAQLHQLRGRIGRGTEQSYCLLFGQPTTETAQQRLDIMAQTNDGFRIAEEDLRIRGPGEFFGTAQHGLPQLKIANIIEDIDLLRMAQRDAFKTGPARPLLKKPHACPPASCPTQCLRRQPRLSRRRLSAQPTLFDLVLIFTFFSVFLHFDFCFLISPLTPA